MQATTQVEPWSPQTVQQWRQRCLADQELTHLAAAAEVTFTVGCEDGEFTVSFAGAAVDVDSEATPAFSFRASTEAWEKFFSAPPPPPFHGIFAMLMRVPSAQVEGDELTFVQHAHLVRRVLEIGRELTTGWSRPADVDGAEEAVNGGETDDIVGRYAPVPVAGRPTRVFYEEAGTGHDVVFLHTAGADGRQYHHLMNDAQLRRRCRMVALDLPWHGRSAPLGTGLPGSYELSTDLYVSVVMALVGHLQLNSPIVVGSSMGGEICLELAYRYPDQLGGVVACEASDHVPGRQTSWARHPQVNQALYVPEWVDGLMAPQSPQRFRREVWWGYSQSGFGSFYGDICFYSGEWDGRDRVSDIDTSRCQVVMLTGEYDYSCTPQMSKETAAKIPGATFEVMPGLGHFPMAENPPLFAQHLHRALDQIGVRR